MTTSSSLALSIATFKAQALNAMLGLSGGNASTNPLFASTGSPNDFLSALAANGMPGLSPSGRNMTLADPESAYRMMTLINDKDVVYKAQFSELSRMESALATIRDAATSLGGMTTDTTNDAVASQLKTFVGQYNDWIQRFDADMQAGGLLAGTQAAQVARHELSQNIASTLNGAADGVHGLADLGITIDPASGLASLDTAKLNTLLASNKQGVVDAVQQFSANFAASATLLDSTGNFIPNQLDNLNRVIQYITTHEDALVAEFGTGDPAKPNPQVAQALAAYNQAHGTV